MLFLVLCIAQANQEVREAKCHYTYIIMSKSMYAQNFMLHVNVHTYVYHGVAASVHVFVEQTCQYNNCMVVA